MKKNKSSSQNEDVKTEIFRLTLLKYQYLVERCIDIAEIAIDQNIQLNSMLHTYQIQIQTLKKIAATNPFHGVGPDFLLDEIIVLEKSAKVLDEHVEEAKTCALGKIGLLFDSLRVASEKIQCMTATLPPSNYYEHAKRKLTDNNKKIETICSKLIEQNIVDRDLLNKLTSPIMRRSQQL